MVVHLTASPCYGGPERQMLQLGRELAPDYESAYLTFREEERCWDFVRNAQEAGFHAAALKHDTPRLLAAYRELKGLLRGLNADVLICHGYKAGILGRLAARSLGLPVVAVSRGWTGESFPVRLFEWLDRVNLRWMDRVVCVSEAQAARVRKAGVAEKKITVIHNAIRAERFERPKLEYRQRLLGLFPDPPDLVIGSAGRFSPEKGFQVLVDAFCEVARAVQSAGLVLFGDGPERNRIAKQIADLDLGRRCVLAGFRDDLDDFMPHFDVFVLPSFTEGLPNVALEALAARVPVVATAVGGTPEVVRQGIDGYLVPPGDPGAMAGRIVHLLPTAAESESATIFRSRLKRKLTASCSRAS